MTNHTSILLRNGFVTIANSEGTASPEALATIMMNLSYYGKALNVEAYRALTNLSGTALVDWWMAMEKELKSITGADRKMGDFVVYKNFPAEVLEKSAAEYWIPQLLMYWGVPNEFFTEPVKPREKMSEQPRPSVLRLANKDTLRNILNSLLAAPARWKDQEFEDVLFLVNDHPVNLAKMAFKENLVRLAAYMIDNGRKINLPTATDVLRLAVGLSDGDVSLRTKSKFRSFKKPERRYLLDILEQCNNKDEDFARRPEMFKRLLHQLHPGDYKHKYEGVCMLYNMLYRNELCTFNSSVEHGLLKRDPHVLDLLSQRPGEFRRRLVHTLDVFGDKAAKAFVAKNVLDKMTTHQVVATRRLIETYNTRENRIFPPKGNWAKAQIAEEIHHVIDQSQVHRISKALGAELSKRVPKVKTLDALTDKVKLPNNGEVGPYARGTTFPIPEGIQFIRTASYWKCKTEYNSWFDNGWNFFDSNWKQMGAICWDLPKYNWGAAAFSGDPTNTKDSEGRACQVIDLYLDKLARCGVRYAVWNVLCFSRIPFSKADEVFAALQWGEDAEKGKLFEPSRNQLAFQLNGEQHTKYVCLIDLQTREMVYLDANLKAEVSSANRNCDLLEKTMPAFMEYLNSLPSVHDLFRESVNSRSKKGAHILYSDKDTELQDVSAYVFKPENKANKYKQVDINSLL